MLVLVLPWPNIDLCVIDGASKHAFQAFYDSLRAEVADRKIDVVLVSPSYIKTNLSKNASTGKSDGSTLGGNL